MIWKRVILSWMTLLALVFASAGATAGADLTPKTHVGAIDLVVAISIEASGLASAEERRGNWDAVTTGTSDVPPAARGAGRVCFAAGTQVETSEGPMAIEDVKVGDLVWSMDEETGEIALKRVFRTFVTEGKEVLELVVADESGIAEAVTVTAEHPFWVAERGWVEAGDLRADDVLSSLDGGASTVLSLEMLEEQTTVYNFEVEDFHTYFVGDGDIWVHNTCGAVFKTTKEAAEAAGKLGFRKVRGATSKGEAVFTDGKRFITRDNTGHSGGAFKMADSIKGLGSKKTRTGTFDTNLNKIGD